MIAVQLLLLTIAYLVSARIDHLSVSLDSRKNIYLQTFGFDVNGKIKLSISNFKLDPVPSKLDLGTDGSALVGVALRGGINGNRVRIPQDDCLIKASADAGNSQKVLTPDSGMYADWNNFEVGLTVKDAAPISLLFSNCLDAKVSFDMTLVMYNVDEDGNLNYLSSGEEPYPACLFILFVCFVLETIVWFVVCRKQRSHVKGIHHLMTLVLVFKALNLFFEAFRYQNLAETGADHGSWYVLYYITSFIKGMLLFSAIVLIGTGWSYMRPVITPRDKKIVIALLILQILSNTAVIVVEEESPGDKTWFAWRDVFRIVDMVSWVAILLPILGSMKHLEEMSKSDEKAAENLVRLQKFRRFYLLTIAYIYFTHIIMLLIENFISYNRQWIRFVTIELAALVFYGLSGYLFQPKNPYVPLSSVDLDLAEFDHDNLPDDLSALQKVSEKL